MHVPTKHAPTRHALIEHAPTKHLPTMRLRLMTSCLLFCVAVAGCASSADSTVARPGEPITLTPGQQIALPDDTLLRYVEVSADSRCPPDVQCIRAGDADVLFRVEPAQGAPRQMTLNTAKARSASIDAWQLKLLELGFGPAPPATIMFEATSS